MRKVLNDQREIDVRYYLEQWARWPTVLRGSSGGIGGTVIGRLMSGKRMMVCSLCKGKKKIAGALIGSPYPVVVCTRCDGAGYEPTTLDTESRMQMVDCDVCRVYDDRSKRYRSTGELPDGRTCHKCHGGRRRLMLEACDCNQGTTADGAMCSRCNGSRVAPVREDLVHPATISGTRYYGANTDPDPVSAMLDRTIATWAKSNLTYWLNAVVMMEYRSEYLGRVVAGGMTQGEKAEAMHVSRPWYTRNLSEAHVRVEALLHEFFTRTIDRDVIKNV